MAEMEPHEELKAKGLLVVFQRSLGNAAFVSHQWVGHEHPDPEFKQMRVLQAALKYAMSSSLKHIPLDIVTELLLPGAKDMPTSELVEKDLFIWYDYFSCPQLERKPKEGERSELSKAIESIPAYVAASAFFFVLCPVIENEHLSKVFSPSTWAQRGWCRLERACCELGQNQSWIMVKAPTSLELISCPSASMGSSPPGQGEFSLAEDRKKVAPVLTTLLKRKLLQLLQAQDFVSYRVLLNQQSVYLKGLGLHGSCYKPVPGFEEKITNLEEMDSTSCLVEEFLYQNGFNTVGQRDAGGWMPLHYAALSGDSSLIHGLLAKRANPNCKTTKDQPLVGLPPLTSALSICVFFRHYEATQCLISARASLSGGSTLCTPLIAAVIADSAEGVRLLCQARCDPHRRNLVGAAAFDTACAHGTIHAVEELLLQTGGRGLDMTLALNESLTHHGGSAELVKRLLDLRADVNDQTFTWWKPGFGMGLIAMQKNLQHKCGKRTLCSKLMYHGGHGGTPLMLAMLTYQYEAAACLIAEGARLDSRNSRGWTAKDFAAGQPVPDFLLEAFEGSSEGCCRVTSIALRNACVEL